MSETQLGTHLLALADVLETIAAEADKLQSTVATLEESVRLLGAMQRNHEQRVDALETAVGLLAGAR